MQHKGKIASASRASGDVSSLTKAIVIAAFILRRALHRDDVRASARLRDGDRERVRKPERRVIERGDRGRERSASKRDLQLDQVLDVERRMIRAAARDGGDERRLRARNSVRQLPRSTSRWQPIGDGRPRPPP